MHIHIKYIYTHKYIYTILYIHIHLYIFSNIHAQEGNRKTKQSKRDEFIIQC